MEELKKFQMFFKKYKKTYFLKKKVKILNKNVLSCITLLKECIV